MFEEVALLTKKQYKKLPKNFTYGTAGFRTIACDLDTVLFRMGVLAVLRSKCTKAHIGLMITASHNPECDNGVKLVDPLGEMMAQTWEVYATDLANVADEDILEAVKKIMKDAQISEDVQGRVVVGRDTRSSSTVLHQCAVDGIRAAGGEVIECGVVTTPILHYRVCTANDGGKYGVPSNEGYAKKLISSFIKLQKSSDVSPSNYNKSLVFDGANGVGGLQMSGMRGPLSEVIDITLLNDGVKSGVLNYQCGADYVKTGQCWPTGVPQTANSRCASVDGDADRVVYSYIDGEGKYHLMDGDKIATLIAAYFKQLLTTAGLSLSLGLVQTAYANGASTHYITDSLAVPVSCAKTGVKHLHHMALNYDVGVYFEANGHGTVIFSAKAKEVVANAAKNGNSHASRLLTIIDLINETVGDAISDMLLVEVILKERGWSMGDWDSAYVDLPNKLVKVFVKDRSIISTTNAERTCVSPAAIQPAIDALVANETYGKAMARAFIRPSGTEDVVRVYAEAKTSSLVETLSQEVSRIVYDFANGVGDRP